MIGSNMKKVSNMDWLFTNKPRYFAYDDMPSKQVALMKRFGIPAVIGCDEQQGNCQTYAVPLSLQEQLTAYKNLKALKFIYFDILPKRYNTVERQFIRRAVHLRLAIFNAFKRCVKKTDATTTFAPVIEYVKTIKFDKFFHKHLFKEDYERYICALQISETLTIDIMYSAKHDCIALSFIIPAEGINSVYTQYRAVEKLEEKTI